MIRYVVFEVSLQDSVLQMEESNVSEAVAHGRLINWIAIDADSQRQTMTILGVFASASADRSNTVLLPKHRKG